jgi:hypothetical protein
MLVTMEPNSPAEDLPSLYRQILDRVAEIEAAGDRNEAARVRRTATAAYSRAWDERARRELAALLRRAEQPTPTERLLGRGLGRGVGRGLGRRSRPMVAPDH